jgi:hypothetical protein
MSSSAFHSWALLIYGKTCHKTEPGVNKNLSLAELFAVYRIRDPESTNFKNLHKTKPTRKRKKFGLLWFRFIVHYFVTMNDEISHAYGKRTLCERLGLLDP